MASADSEKHHGGNNSGNSSSRQVMEYREVRPQPPLGTHVTEEQLNNLAAEGWRVVFVSYGRTSQNMMHVLLERPTP